MTKKDFKQRNQFAMDIIMQIISSKNSIKRFVVCCNLLFYCETKKFIYITALKESQLHHCLEAQPLLFLRNFEKCLLHLVQGNQIDVKSKYRTFSANMKISLLKKNHDFCEIESIIMLVQNI
jgi:hypothetical protein